MQISTLLDACEFILAEVGEPQSSYWLASQIMEAKLWRASEAEVRDTINKNIVKFGDESLFIRVADNEFALRSWASA